MLILGSNARLHSNNNVPWMGSDTHIHYPQVSTCITITCLVDNKLAGCHLFYKTLSDWMEADLKAFSKIAKNPSAMCIAGVLECWSPDHKHNTTGYNLSTLTAKIRKLTKFKGIEQVHDMSNLEQTLDLRYVPSGISCVVS